MAAPKSPYRKLTRMSRGIGLMTQLWLGPDHLLQVQSTGYTETYQRFYLRDIQALQVVHGDRRLYYGLTFAGIGLIASLIALAAEGEWPVFAIIWGVLLPLLLWNHLLGPGCRVVIITAVQQERIPSLSRLPKTRRVLAELKPLIEAAQSDLTQLKSSFTPAAVPAPAGADGAPPVLAASEAGAEPPLVSASAPTSPPARTEPPALPPPLPAP